MYGNVGVEGYYLTPRNKTDAYAPIVSEPAGYYINLRVIQKFTPIYYFWFLKKMSLLVRHANNILL